MSALPKPSRWLPGAAMLAFGLFCAGDRVRAEEPPVTSGLIFRISADTLATDSAPTADTRLEVWPDSTPAGSAQHQPDAARRPSVFGVGESRVVRFDGVDDVLQFRLNGRTIAAATIYLVGAPHRNEGEFRAFMAANAPGQRDYQSGFNIDLGPGPGRSFDVINLEGPGFGGAQNLAAGSRPFGSLVVMEATADPERKEVRLIVDGKPAGRRPFDPQRMSLDQLTVGARFYTNSPDPQQARGYLACDIAEILIFDRVLSVTESESVRNWLEGRHATLRERLPETIPELRVPGIPLVRIEDAPAIQVLQPGFRVRELPLQLTNVNNVRYRRDGKLVTLGYNGDIHLLTDTDGDGLEDHAALFWKNEGSIRGPIGLALTPPDYVHGNGVFVPSKGKVSLIVDQDGDDRADREIVVASGWQEIAQNVDAVGIALDKQHNIYFALGTANYANAYLIDDQGQSAWDINSVRGTVQRVSADFSERTTVCTGVRFPVAMAFNPHGDLFCSEQEGATWLPNGNPFDELLHIQPDRHYGFPPRHPRHNPGVIDEPSTFDFGPQHQSTCGLFFNVGVNGGPAFGPDHWEGDAIVCGESRGKLWRTTLVRTEAGYVASSQLFAALQMLTVDACVSPDGSLVVACHSGPPDWGTGPAGIGKLFRVETVREPVARPVAACAEGPQELRVAFDQPLDPDRLKQITQGVRAEHGRYVRAGDRFENLIPPYAVVQAQAMTPRYELPVRSVAITPDLRTVILNTGPIPWDHFVAVTLPGMAGTATESGILGQLPEMDVDLSQTGVRATWRATAVTDEHPAEWTGWLPHPDLSVAETLLRESAGHSALREALQHDGSLTLETQINVHDFLRPAIQPGASIDYEWPDEQVTVTCTASQPFELQFSGGGPDEPVFSANVTGERNAAGDYVAAWTAPPNAAQPIALTIRMQTTAGTAPELRITAHTNEDTRPRPLPLQRFLLPWVDVNSESDSDPAANRLRIAELEGGSWSAGRKVFHSEAAGCSKCHAIGGDEATIGPSLANLVHRDYASVVRDVSNPGFAINPDYISHAVVLQDGRILTGVLQSDGDELLVGDAEGKRTRIRQTDVEALRPSTESIMPRGIVEKLPADAMRDLLTYLLTPPPSMPLESPLTAPPLRTQAEVSAALDGSVPISAPLRPLRILLVAGPKDHGPGEHDYPAWQTVWEDLLSAADEVTIQTAWEFPTREQLDVTDVAIFFQKGAWNSQRSEPIDEFLRRGGGLVYIHWAVNGDDNVGDFAKRIGYASWGGRISFRHGPLSLDIHNQAHPIVRNFSRLELYDESYWKLTGDPGDVTLLATSTEEGQATPQMWVTEKDAGRVFVSIPGHYSWTFDDPLFRILLLRGIAWSAKEPVDRFNALVPIGARMTQ